MKNLRKSMVFLMLAALLLAGCNEKYDPITDKVIQELSQDIPASSDGYETFVSLEQATSVAEAFFGKTALKSAAEGTPKTDASIEMVRDSDNSPLMYWMKMAIIVSNCPSCNLKSF